MIPLYIVYRDLQTRDLPPGKANGFEIANPQPGALMVKPQIIPGLFGYSPIHITHIEARAVNFATGIQRDLLIIAYTNRVIEPEQKQEIAARATFYP